MTNLFAKSVIKLTKLVIPELLTSKSSIHWSFITLLTGSNSGHTLIKWPHSRGFSMPPSSHFLNTSKTKPQKDLMKLESVKWKFHLLLQEHQSQQIPHPFLKNDDTHEQVTIH